MDVSVGTPTARDDATSNAQVGAADEDEAGDPFQGTDLLSMMEEAGEENEELGDSAGTASARDGAAEAEPGRQRMAQPTKQQGKQQRKRVAAAKVKAQFQGSDVHEMLGGDDEGTVELEGRQHQQVEPPMLTTKQTKKQRLREKKRAANKGRVGHHQKGAPGSADAAVCEAAGGKQGQSQAESEGS